MFAYDTIFQALYDDLFPVRHLDHVAFTFDELHTITDDSVCSFKGFSGFRGSKCYRPEAAPGAKVTPTEFGRQDECELSLFHNGIVDGDLLAGWEEFIDLGLLIWGEEAIYHLIHYTGNLWCELTKFVHDR